MTARRRRGPAVIAGIATAVVCGISAFLKADTTLLSESFERYATGQDPIAWSDTGPRSSLEVDDGLFAVFNTRGNRSFGTISTANDIHSHYQGDGSSEWRDYTFTGRLMISSASGGTGVTFLSDYPNSDSYYRIRCVTGGTFHVAPHPWNVAGITSGMTDSGVSPFPNEWYRFRVLVKAGLTQTLIRGRFWPDGTAEPADWQISCYDNSAIRRTHGTVGIWGHGPGAKWWDDLEVVSITANGGSGTEEPPADPDPTDPPPSSGEGPWWELDSSSAWPGDAQEFTGRMGSFGFDIYQDQNNSWWFHDVDMNGNGADSTLYAVGTACRVERAAIYGGKHGIRMASVNGLLVSDSTIKSDPSNLGKSLKICGSYGRGPASRFVTVRNCDITGIVAIQPLNSTPEASVELVEYVVLRNCVIKPYGNTAVEIAARHIWLENCTFDFRGTSTPYGRGVHVRTYNTIVPKDVTVRNCRLLLRDNQYGDLIVSEIPINP